MTFPLNLSWSWASLCWILNQKMHVILLIFPSASAVLCFYYRLATDGWIVCRTGESGWMSNTDYHPNDFCSVRSLNASPPSNYTSYRFNFKKLKGNVWYLECFMWFSEQLPICRRLPGSGEEVLTAKSDLMMVSAPLWALYMTLTDWCYSMWPWNTHLHMM